MHQSYIEQHIEKELLNLATNPLFPWAAIHIIVNDLLFVNEPPVGYERIVSFEAILLFFLISKNQQINLSKETKRDETLEQEIRKLLKEFETSFVTTPHLKGLNTREDIINELHKHLHSQSVLAASFLYSSDEAYPSQYLFFIPQRYELDQQWLFDNLGITLQDMFECMCYLLSDASPNINTNTHNALDLLLVDLANLPQKIKNPMKIFIKLFATNLANTNELSLENLLMFQSKPILKINDTCLLMPPAVILLQAVCESPLYWMIDDKNYAPKAWKNRGDITVDMVFQWMKKIFGEQHVFQNVLIKKHKQDITDIDVLVIFQNKAIIFQIKSKKMTLATKLGDSTKFIDDFNKSIQNAYEQAILSIKSIKNRECKFLYKGQCLEISSNINSFYIFCVTTEQFKTLNIRLQETIKIDPEFASIPVIAISAFDLQVLSLYLYTPYDFLYYLHRREMYLSAIIFPEEINILVAFLEQGLRNFPVDRIFFANDFLDSLNAHFRPWPTPQLIKQSYKWKSSFKEEIIASIMLWNHYATNDLITFLYDNYEAITVPMLRSLIRMNRERIFQLLNSPHMLLNIFETLSHKIGRNEKCPCGSGKKYKHCCGQ